MEKTPGDKQAYGEESPETRNEIIAHEACRNLLDILIRLSRDDRSYTDGFKIFTAELFGKALVAESLIKMREMFPDSKLDIGAIIKFSQGIGELIKNDEFWKVLEEKKLFPFPFAESKEDLLNALKESKKSLERLTLENFEPSEEEKGH